MKYLALMIAAILVVPTIAHADEQRAKNKALRAALMTRFDANGDGRLGPRERMRAARVLRRIEMKLAGKGQLRRKIIRRFDANRDGNVDQREMPPRAARKLRRFDRDRDGWLEPNE